VNFREIGAALGGREMAVSRLQDIYNDVIGAEKTHLKAVEDAKTFRDAASEVFEFDRESRSWGDSYFVNREIDEIEMTEDGICLRYSTTRPCGRGCCYDSVYDGLTIPASLIDARDEYDDGSKYQEALRSFIEERASKVRQYMAEQTERAETKRLVQEQAREEKERAEFLRLQAKYGEN
jgi:rubrerythrin